MNPFNDNYKAYIRGPIWKAKRAERLKLDNHTCQVCKKAIATQVHHLTYIRFMQELIEDLLSVCTPCHRIITRSHRSSPQLKTPEKIFM